MDHVWIFQAATATGPLKYSKHLKAINICETMGGKKGKDFIIIIIIIRIV